MADGPFSQKWCSPLQFCWHWQIPPANQVWRPLFWSPRKKIFIYKRSRLVLLMEFWASAHGVRDTSVRFPGMCSKLRRSVYNSSHCSDWREIARGAENVSYSLCQLLRSKFRFIYVVALSSSMCSLLWQLWTQSQCEMRSEEHALSTEAVCPEQCSCHSLSQQIQRTHSS